jgi:hypothetical protein
LSATLARQAEIIRVDEVKFIPQLPCKLFADRNVSETQINPLIFLGNFPDLNSRLAKDKISTA